MEFCGELYKLEIDIGVIRIVLNEEMYNKLCDKVELKSLKVILSIYIGEKILVLGEVLIFVKY